MVLGKLHKALVGRRITGITRTDGTSPPPITPTTPRAISHLKFYALQMATRNAPFLNKLKVLIDQLGRAAEEAVANKDLSVGMLKDLRFKAKDLY